MKKIGVFPKMGDYTLPINILMEQAIGYQMMVCPPITARTVEIGAKHSPDTVCTPFKVTLGNFIEALEKGANMLFMPGFGCRLGFYDMLHEKILKGLGYEFQMVALCDYIASPHRVFKTLQELEPDACVSREKFDEIFALVAQIVVDMDELAEQLRRNSAFEVLKGSHEKIYQSYLKEARKLIDIKDAFKLCEKYKVQMNDIEIKRPEKYLRIGIVGDSYTVIEPHGNCEMVKWLIDNKVEVVKPTDLTYYAEHIFDVPGSIANSGGYVKYALGGNANSTIAQAYKMVNEKLVDGVIHIKAATCSPEISAMTILQDISNDFEIPFMYMTFDTETGEAGVHTRLEAFCDMLSMKSAIKQKKKAV